MEADEIQRKLPRLDSLGDQKRNMDGGGAVDLSGISGKFYGWPSSRIVRVSRASGGKDRHSKVLTSKGLRDRRVRLSVNTAIQFYDLQDRLGVDQPSKALEWLLKAAASSITELPPMSTLFPDTPKQENDEKRSSAGGGTGQLGSGSVDKMDSGASPDPSTTHQQLAKCSACSSNSETNTCFGLSLPRSDSRAMELVAEKEKENKSLNHISRTTSFTALLSGGTTTSPNSCSGGTTNTNESRLSQKSPPRQWSSSAPMDYFGGFSCAPAAVLSRPAANPLFSMNHHQQPEFQQFSIFPDQLLFPVVNAAARGDHSGSSEYNFNFKVSSGSSSSLSGFNRGTLQSNSSSPSLPHLQRFPAMDGSSPPGFYVGTVENHHQFLSQLCYDAHPDGRHSDQKSKGKN